MSESIKEAGWSTFTVRSILQFQIWIFRRKLLFSKEKHNKISALKFPISEYKTLVLKDIYIVYNLEFSNMRKWYELNTVYMEVLEVISMQVLLSLLLPSLGHTDQTKAPICSYIRHLAPGTELGWYKRKKLVLTLTVDLTWISRQLSIL